MNESAAISVVDRLKEYRIVREAFRPAASQAEALGALLDPAGASRPSRTIAGLQLLYGLMLTLLSDPDFPLPTAGLLHVSQEWEYHGAVPDEVVLEGSIGDVTERKGMIYFTFSIEARSPAGEPVATMAAKLLSQGRAA